MKKIKLRGKKVPYKIRKSEKAENYRLEIDIDRVLKVIIPKGGERKPESLIKEKESWILEKLEKYEDLFSRIPKRGFEDGETLPFLGEDYELKIKNNGRKGVDIKKGEMIVNLDGHSKEKVKDVLENWYREKARSKITKFVNEYSKELDVDYNKIYIRNQRTRWGSTSSKQNLNFNWRLMMAPEGILEYVVIHELVHLDEKNHTKHFWEKVRAVCPEYKERERWLKRNSPKLVFSEEDY